MPTRTNTETPGRGASNEVTYARVRALLVSFCFFDQSRLEDPKPTARARIEFGWAGRDWLETSELSLWQDGGVLVLEPAQNFAQQQL